MPGERAENLASVAGNAQACKACESSSQLQSTLAKLTTLGVASGVHLA